MAKKAKPVSAAMKKKLSLASKKFKKVDAAAGSSLVNEAIVDGRYGFDLKKALLKEQGAKLVVEFHLELSEVLGDGDEDSVGEVAVARFNLETEQNLSYLKKALSMFVDIDDDFDLAESLEETLAAIEGAEPTGACSVRMNGEFQQVYINKVETDGDDSDADDDEDEDEKPAKSKKKTASGGKGGKGKGKSSKSDDDENDDEDDDAEDDSDDDEDAPEIAKGDEVLFTPPKSRKAKTCVVKKIKNGKADLEDEDGKKYVGIKVEVLEAVDPENDDSDDDEDDEDEKPAKKKGKGKKGKDADDDEDDAEEIEEGSKVSLNFKGEEVQGKVVSVDEDEETVEVKFKHKGKTITKSFPADKLEAV